MVSPGTLARPSPGHPAPGPSALARRRRTVAAVVAAVAILAPVGWFWWTSLVPATYSVMGMGYLDPGGGPISPGHRAHDSAAWGGPPAQPGDVSVAALTGPKDRAPDVSVTLAAAAQRVTLPGGPTFEGFTIGGTTPGPTIEATEGDLVQVTVVNTSVPDGVALHWHGVRVPNAEDGVAGVTQDAVGVGERFVYRFVATDAGTYWYHAHQLAHRQVRLGLFGALVVHPRAAAARKPADQDVLAVLHTYAGSRTVNGTTRGVRVVAAPGSVTRVRVVNTDNAALRVWVVGAPLRVLAIDGRDLSGPTPVEGKAVLLAAGGRADLEVVAPADGSGALVRLGAGVDVVVGPKGVREPAGAATVAPKATLDLLGYGRAVPLAFDPRRADRTFTYAIGRRFAFVDGRPGLHWSVNGHTFPDIPMFLVSEGDVVRMTISNSSGKPHPMHLHGHHMLVLSRDGVPSTGSPWWSDSLEVAGGERYEVAFVADNPGIWLDHCHNLPHAAEGLVAHLVYSGVSEPYRIGGSAANKPE